MVAEHVDDGEGEMLRRVRAVVGPGLPIAVSLDLHANVTPEMVEHADVLDIYRTYPHVDMAATGRRSALQLAALIEGGTRRSEEHTSELQSLMRNSYAVFCLKKTKK